MLAKSAATLAPATRDNHSLPSSLTFPLSGSFQGNGQGLYPFPSTWEEWTLESHRLGLNLDPLTFWLCGRGQASSYSVLYFPVL